MSRTLPPSQSVLAQQDVPTVQLTLQPIVKSGVSAPPQNLTRITDVSITSGSYGTVGTATIETAGSAMPLNMSKNARRGPFTVALSLYPGPIALFTGMVDDITYELEQDKVTITCRDNGCKLQETTLEPRSFTKCTLGSAVAQLAAATGVTLQPPLSAALIDSFVTPALGAPPNIGAYFKDGYYFTSHRVPAWGVLHKLAQAFGLVTYFAPNGQLYFGPRDNAPVFLTPVVTLKFRATTTDGTLKKLSVKHQTNRHSFFTVRMTSHNRQKGEQNSNTATYVNEQLATDLANAGQNQFADPGIYTGLTQEAVAASIPGLPLYELNAAGLQNDANKAEALSKAQEIQGQEFVIEGTTLPQDGIIDIGDPLLLDVEDSDLFDGVQFTATSVKYTWSLTEGLLQHFTAWRSPAIEQEP